METSNTCTTPIKCLFQNKVMRKITTIIYDQPLLSGHLPVPRGWLLNEGSTVLTRQAIESLSVRTQLIKLTAHVLLLQVNFQMSQENCLPSLTASTPALVTS